MRISHLMIEDAIHRDLMIQLQLPILIISLETIIVDKLQLSLHSSTYILILYYNQLTKNIQHKFCTMLLLLRYAFILF